MSARHCIWTLLLLVAVPATAQQEAPAGASETHGYAVFVGGTLVGREDVTVHTSDEGTTITAKGRIANNIVIEEAEVTYEPDWTPETLLIEATVGGSDTTLRTTFSGDTAVTEGVDGGQAISRTEVVSFQMLVLPRVFFGSYEALTRQLAEDPSGSQFRAFIAPGTQVGFRVRPGSTERMQTGTSTFDVRHYELFFDGEDGELMANLYADSSGSLVRLNVPSQQLDVVRDDVASATARTVMYSNPGDEAVIIPARGFNLGATLTRPASPPGGSGQTAARLPAVVLLSSFDANERDGVISGVSVIGQLAGALAEAGFLTVRYDRRGYGQSGGRAESATLRDFAEDAQQVVRWLADRDDVDRDRIAILGHGDGAWTALLTAAREGRISAVVTIAAPSTTGAELVLEQQRQVLDALKTPEAERQNRIALQQQINAAVLSGEGWDELPQDIRRRADTPWFQSLLAFEPVEVLEDVDQPLLLVHGTEDRQVPASHVDRLALLAREEGDSESVSVVTVKDVDHQLVPIAQAVPGTPEHQERARISTEATAAIAEWLSGTLSSRDR